MPEKIHASDRFSSDILNTFATFPFKKEHPVIADDMSVVLLM